MRIPFAAPPRLYLLHEAQVAISMCASTVFHNDYLLGIIAGFVSDRPCLLAFMRVSYACFLVVRKYIWETVPTTYYILRLLPFFTFEDNMWVIPKTAKPSPWEWQRFDLYAPYVSHVISFLSSTVVGEHDINPLSYLHLVSARGNKLSSSPIFPHLQTFSFHGAGFFADIVPSRIDYLCTTILKDVEIRVNGLQLQTYLCNLLVSMDTLTTLAIIGRFTPQCFTVLMRFRNLKKLLLQNQYASETEKQTISPQLVQFLGNACKNISLTHVVLRSYIPSLLPADCFSSIQHLEIQEASSTIINVLGSGSFRTVILRFTKFELISSYHACCSALVRSSLETLASLTIHSQAEIKHDFPVIHCIEPILSITNLRELTIHHGNILNMAMSDGDISRMAHAWPGLKRLVLLNSTATAAGRIRNQQPTFESIRVLLRMEYLKNFSIRVEQLPIDIQFPLREIDTVNYPFSLRQYLLWVRQEKRKRNRA